MVISEGQTAEECCEELAALVAPYRDQEDGWLESREQLFDERFATTEFGVCRVSPEGVIRDCNVAATALLGYSRRELVGISIAELYAPTPHGRQKASGLFRRFTAGEGFCGEVMGMQRRDGSAAWTSLCVRVVKDADGAVRESISVMHEAEPLAP